jgi:transposase
VDTSENGYRRRRRRRTHSAEFKAQVVAACRQPGMSMAAVALEHRLNANLLRRWVVAEERARKPALIEARTVAQAPSTAANATFVPVEVASPGAVTSQKIVIEVRRGPLVVKVSWPVEAAAACSSWLSELLR